jgi:hypothetical protein
MTHEQLHQAWLTDFRYARDLKELLRLAKKLGLVVSKGPYLQPIE